MKRRISNISMKVSGPRTVLGATMRHMGIMSLCVGSGGRGILVPDGWTLHCQQACDIVTQCDRGQSVAAEQLGGGSAYGGGCYDEGEGRKRDKYRVKMMALGTLGGWFEEVVFLLKGIFSIILGRNQGKTEWECHPFLVLRVKAKG